jgi:1,4-dihydroxy-2-naphthoate octaprenyltransferase
MRLVGFKISKILKIIRLHILAGGALAFLLGALLAIVEEGTFDPARIVLSYVVVLLGDLSTHYSNDYFDVEVDKYVRQKKFFSGSNILVDNPSLRPLARSISITLLISSIVLAAVAVLFMGAPIELLVITLGASFLGWFYSAPPVRLISRGLGEISVALATGFAIPGVGYLAVRGRFDPLFIYLTIPFMMYGLMLSLSLEAPDREIDLEGGKRNIVVRKGERVVFSLILVMALSATLAFVFYAWKIPSSILDLRVVAVFSGIPLTAGLFGFANVLQKKNVDQFGTLNILSLFLFNILMIAYLLMISI